MKIPVFRTILSCFLFLLFCLTAFSAQATVTDCSSVTEIPRVECQALMDLYDDTNGAEWVENTGWNTTNNPCSWHGVTCQGGHVHNLHLRSNNLVGTLPTSLGDLQHLYILDLGNNQISGPIPTEVGWLAGLRNLTLDHNELYGFIPTSIGYTNLSYLNLGFNRLSGPIPSELQYLSDLTYLYLYTNRLAGHIFLLNSPLLPTWLHSI